MYRYNSSVSHRHGNRLVSRSLTRLRIPFPSSSSSSGCCVQCAADIVETLVKAPFKICMWITDDSGSEVKDSKA